MTKKSEAEFKAPRGMRDCEPSESLARNALVTRLKKYFELYGFVPLETPALENWSVLANKYAGGDEILKEAYRLKDQGKRELGLRYDLTVPLCRYVASNPRLATPFKRYQVASVWRDGPVSSQRLREFLQCDADVVGVEGMSADAEIVALASDFFSSLGLPFAIRVNNRKALEALVDYCGIPREKWLSVLLSLDKLEKIGESAVWKELIEGKSVNGEKASKLLTLVKDLKAMSNEDALKFLEETLSSSLGKQGVAELKELFEYARALGAKNVRLDASLARGLAYYTGTVFEVFLAKGGVDSAVAAGGRYDDLISSFSGAKQKTPAVGISFGVERLMQALRDAGKVTEKKSTARAFVVPIKKFRESLKTVAELRAAGVACGVDLLSRSLSRNLECADKQGVAFVVIVGEKELKEGKVKLRNMQSGEEKLLTTKQAIDQILSSEASGIIIS